MFWLYCQMMSERLKLEGQTKAHMVERAKVMKALAHPSRLFIVDELSRGERCVCELTEMIGAERWADATWWRSREPPLFFHYLAILPNIIGGRVGGVS